MGKTEAQGGNWGLTRSHMAIQGQTALEPSPHAPSLYCALARELGGHTLPGPASGITFSRGPKSPGQKRSSPGIVPVATDLLKGGRGCPRAPDEDDGRCSAGPLPTAAPQTPPPHVGITQKRWTEAAMPEPLSSARNSPTLSSSDLQPLPGRGNSPSHRPLCRASPRGLCGWPPSALRQDAASLCPRRPWKPAAGALGPCA